MIIASTKKLKEIEKEIKGKLIQVIENSLFGKNDVDKKVKKTIKNAASEIAKKFAKSLKKNKKKTSKAKAGRPGTNKTKLVKKKSPQVKAKRVTSNGKAVKSELS